MKLWQLQTLLLALIALVLLAFSYAPKLATPASLRQACTQKDGTELDVGQMICGEVELK